MMVLGQSGVGVLPLTLLREAKGFGTQFNGPNIGILQMLYNSLTISIAG